MSFTFQCGSTEGVLRELFDELESHLHSSVVLLKVQALGYMNQYLIEFTFQCGSTEGIAS